ncbi:endonuclease/exonuclease/phosphatase family protein [Myxococcota bacterium]|nr:endonuclease/exonuclease/phosphatase family protein [Myxococcota bacterium]MBU1431400.1 endonuclease/exonuclease/phosphatase family protein [Myxococcota bacterium]MBU1898518.1 endonuclease/exonuclease/phosphatase family protein [Myxococcota bacterium]
MSEILTFNLQCLKDWPDRRHQLAVALSARQPGALLLQEACYDPKMRDEALQYLCGALSGASGVRYEAVWAETHTAWERFREGIAVLTRWPVIRQEIISLPHEGDFPRKAILVECQREAGPVVLACTHLSHRSSSLRIKQSEALLVALEPFAQGAPALVGGDFNAGPEDPAVARFIEAGFHSAHADRLLTFPSHRPSMKIDHILLRGLQAASSARLFESPTLSDHLGLAVTLAP